MPSLESGRLSPADTAGITKALFEYARMYILQSHQDLLQAMQSKIDEIDRSSAPVADLFRVVLREEPNAFKGRQPSQRDNQQLHFQERRGRREEHCPRGFEASRSGGDVQD